MADAKSKNPYYQGPVSDHFDGTRFFNPGGIAPLGFRRFCAGSSTASGSAGQKQVPSPFARPSRSRGFRATDLRVTMVGHASMLVQVAGLNILTDPVWSDRVSPFTFAGPKAGDGTRHPFRGPAARSISFSSRTITTTISTSQR
jgi:hypothetical protein